MPTNDTQVTCHGSCHCGQVAFELDAKLKHVFECNCSLCRLKGALWHGATDQQFRIVKGEGELSLYQFGTMTAKHYFCRHCGVQPFARSRLDPTGWVVNVRCVEGVDLAALQVRHFDGEHFEEAARALYAGRK